MLSNRTTVAATLKVLLDVIPEEPNRIDSTRLVQALAARGFARTPRSVQRQLQEASHLYPIQCLDKTKPYQYSWQRGTKHAASSGDPNTALALWLVFDHLQRLLPTETVALLRRQQTAFDQTLGKAKTPLATWRSRIRIVPTSPARAAAPIDSEVVRVVYDAVLAGKRLEIEYLKHGAAKPRTHEVHPLGILIKGSAVMMVCRFEGKPNAAITLLHRIATAKALKTTAVPPEGFDLDAFLTAGGASFVLGEPVELELRVADGTVTTFREAPLGDGQCIEDDGAGWWRLQTTVADTVDLRGFLMGYGDSIEVVGPPPLRAYFEEQAQNLVRLYGRPSQRPPAPPADLRVRVTKARERAAR